MVTMQGERAVDREGRRVLMIARDFPPVNLSAALRALKFLKDSISTFPFVNDADRSVGLSGFLTAQHKRSLPTAPKILGPPSGLDSGVTSATASWAKSERRGTARRTSARAAA